MAPVKSRSVLVCTCCMCGCPYRREWPLQTFGDYFEAILCALKRIRQSSASQGCCLTESLQLLQRLQQMLRPLDCLVKFIVVGAWCSGSWPARWHRMQDDHISFTRRVHSAQHIDTLMSREHSNTGPSLYIHPVCIR